MIKLFLGKYQTLMFLLLMAFVGVVTVSVGKIALLIGLGVFAVGFIKTVRKRNANGEAHLFVGLIIGAEVYFRMSFSGLPWEFGKIAVISLLLTGMFVERQKRSKPIIYFMYGLLFIPAMFIPEWQDLEHFKKEIMFNLSGHASLIIAAFYFYKRRISIEEFVKFGQWIIYGIMMMSIVLFLKTPDYGSINYGGGSNFIASAGFGPNQVAANLGLGIFIMGFFLLLNRRLFIYKSVDIGLFMLFTLQGLFTLSRGGLMTAGIALASGVIALYIFDARKVIKLLKLNIFKIVLLGILTIVAFMQADLISGGAVSKRYFNIDEYGKQIKEDYSTHRYGIADADIKTFTHNFVTGAGVGGSREGRMESTGISAVHVEFTRMLADHGILGVIALLILFLYPVKVFFGLKDTQTRLVLVTFVMFALVTMSHNAMRLAMPGFMYGVGFVFIYTSNMLSRQQDGRK